MNSEPYKLNIDNVHVKSAVEEYLHRLSLIPKNDSVIDAWSPDGTGLHLTIGPEQEVNKADQKEA